MVFINGVHFHFFIFSGVISTKSLSNFTFKILLAAFAVFDCFASSSAFIIFQSHIVLYYARKGRY